MEETYSKDELTAVIENLICGICIFALGENRQIIPVYLNEGLYRMLGYTHKELERMLRNVRLNIIPDDLPMFEQGINDILKDDGAIEFEFRTVTGNGGIRWLQVRGNLYGKQDGYPLIAVVIFDSTERKAIEEELALQAERLNILSTSVVEHLIDYNSRTDVMNVKINSKAVNKGDIVINDFISNVKKLGVFEEDIDFFSECINGAIRSPLSDSIEFRSNFFEEGENYHWYKANITSVCGADGYVSRVVGRVINIDEDKEKERYLQLRADVDSLTGLYNKGAATVLITEAIKKCVEQNIVGALIMLDLDHFKSVNDTLGHATGDKVIQEAGMLLKEFFKGRDIVGRMGGDEFMVFISEIRDAEDTVALAKKLNELLRRTYSNSNHSVSISASIGIAVCEADDTFESMYAKADKALYVTKENGRDGYTVFEKNM